MEPLRLQFTVACPAERAFALWAEETTRWWPHGHSVSGAPGLTVTFEPRAGGRIFERTPDGAEHDWGGARLGSRRTASSTSGTCGSTAATRPRSR